MLDIHVDRSDRPAVLDLSLRRSYAVPELRHKKAGPLVTLAAASRFGPYEVVGPLGAGGMGEVYRARDPRLQRDVALKILRDGAGRDPRRRLRLLEEARAAGALNHPNILVVHDVGTEGEVPFIVSELVEGAPLRQVLAHGPLPVRELLDLGVQIADGLTAAHEAGLVHRDLKPENVLVSADGRVKIVDFGIAKVETPVEVTCSASPFHTETADGLVWGTAPYMSPEQARGRELDFRSDQFAFGLLLYEMVRSAVVDGIEQGKRIGRFVYTHAFRSLLDDGQEANRERVQRARADDGIHERRDR